MTLKSNEILDPLTDAAKVVELHASRLEILGGLLKFALERLYVHFFPQESLPMTLRELVIPFGADEDQMVEFKRAHLAAGASKPIEMSLAHGANVDWDKVSTSLPKDANGKVISRKPFRAWAADLANQLIQTLVGRATSGEVSAAPSSRPK